MGVMAGEATSTERELGRERVVGAAFTISRKRAGTWYISRATLLYSANISSIQPLLSEHLLSTQQVPGT